MYNSSQSIFYIIFNLYSHASYLAEAQSLLHQDWEVSLQHKTREHNRPANALAKLGLRLRLDFTTWNSPHAEIAPLVGCG